MSTIEKEKAVDDIVGHLLTGPLLKEDVDKTAEDILNGIVAECAHIAESTYIDCAPDEQPIVDLVQRLISEAIYKELG